MSHIRQVMGRTAFNGVQAARSSQAANDLTKNWLNRIYATANDGISKEAHSGLQAMLDFYNRNAD